MGYHILTITSCPMLSMAYFSSFGRFWDLLTCSNVRVRKVARVTLRSDQQGDNTVLPAVFSVSVFCRYQIYLAVGIFPVGITNLARTHFFRKRGAGCTKKGAEAPFFPRKEGQCPLFEGKRGSRQKNDTEMYRPRFPSVFVW